VLMSGEGMLTVLFLSCIANLTQVCTEMLLVVFAEVVIISVDSKSVLFFIQG